jgi:hypothetical protein
MGRGVALADLGQQADGIAQARAGLADWNATGARLMENPVAWSHRRSAHSSRSVRRSANRAGSGRRNDCGDRRELRSGRVVSAEGGRPNRERRRCRSCIMAPARDRHGPEPSRRSLWNCARPQASPDCGPTRASGRRLTTYSRRLTAGSPRASIRPTSRRPRHCLTSSVDIRFWLYPASQPVAGQVRYRADSGRQGRRCPLSRGLGGFTLSSRHGGRVARKAVPDPELPCQWIRSRSWRSKPTEEGSRHSAACRWARSRLEPSIGSLYSIWGTARVVHCGAGIERTAVRRRND